jgi:hypothetical protein
LPADGIISQQFDWTAAPGIYGRQDVSGGFVGIQFSQKAGWCEAGNTSLDGFYDLTAGQFITFGGDSSASLYLQISGSKMAPAFSALKLSASSIEGGATATGTIVLAYPAPFFGVPVQLSSSNPNLLQVPSVADVPSGAKQTRFQITTKPVSATTSVTITASGAGVVKHVTLLLTP